MSAVVVAEPGAVVTGTLAEVWPAGIVTVAGTLAVAGTVDVSRTTAPPGGAAAVSVIVACEAVPPMTDEGVRITEAIGGAAVSLGDAARSKTNRAVMETLPGCGEE